MAPNPRHQPLSKDPQMIVHSARHTARQIPPQKLLRSVADAEREENTFAAVIGLVAIAVLILLVLFM
jgi:hypothetical protein